MKTQKDSPPLTASPPEALYACKMQGCAEEVSNPAERMYWCSDGWYCEDCIDDILYGISCGIRLDEWLKLRTTAAGGVE